MNTIVPVAIVLSMGAGSGLVLRRWLQNKLISSILAGLVATILWAVGMEVLFRLTIPDEDMGKTHYEGILIVFIVAFIASLIALTFISTKSKDTTNMTNQETQ